MHCDQISLNSFIHSLTNSDHASSSNLPLLASLFPVDWTTLQSADQHDHRSSHRCPTKGAFCSPPKMKSCQIQNSSHNLSQLVQWPLVGPQCHWQRRWRHNQRLTFSIPNSAQQSKSTHPGRSAGAPLNCPPSSEHVFLLLNLFGHQKQLCLRQRGQMLGFACHFLQLLPANALHRHRQNQNRVGWFHSEQQAWTQKVGFDQWHCPPWFRHPGRFLRTNQWRSCWQRTKKFLVCHHARDQKRSHLISSKFQEADKFKSCLGNWQQETVRLERKCEAHPNKIPRFCRLPF